MNIISVSSASDPRLAPYSRLTDRQLLNRAARGEATIIVESPKVIMTALRAGCEPLSLLCEERHVEGDAAPIIAAIGDTPVYTGARDVLASLTGYTLTRGVLCHMRRPADRSAEEVCHGAGRVAVIDGVCDTTNIGTIFRSAAALGMDGVLLTRDSCDPLNRRSIRVSMGSVFLVPWAWVDDAVETPRSLGFTTTAMALRGDAIAVDDQRLATAPRLAIILGTEGDGLPAATIAAADHVVTIPMARGVDSLNVAAAAAIAFYETGRGRA